MLPSELSLSTVGESKGNVDVQFRIAGLRLKQVYRDPLGHLAPLKDHFIV